MATATLRVSGMTCHHCVRTVQQTLEAVAGVERADVDLMAGSAVVDFDDARTNPAVLAGAVTAEGYPTVQAGG
jgi:copper chaperone